MVILVEGPRNTGKTFLITHSKFDSYKFPFIPYYKSMMAIKPEDTGHESKEAFHFTTAFDVSLFSMIEAGVIGPLTPLLIDRSFVSNIVLGELQSRITHAEGLQYIDYLAEQGYLEKLNMIYVDKFSAESGRSTNKDDWEFLGYEEQKAKYEQYFKYLKEKYNWEPTRFINQMTKGDIIEFDKAVLGIHIDKSKDTLKKGKAMNKITFTLLFWFCVSCLFTGGMMFILLLLRFNPNFWSCFFVAGLISAIITATGEIIIKINEDE